MAVHLFNNSFTGTPRTCELWFDDMTDTENATYVLSGKLNAGWELAAVHVVTSWETVVTDITNVSDIMELLETLSDNPYDTSRILAYGEGISWSDWGIFDDAPYCSGDSRSDAAYEYHDSFGAVPDFSGTYLRIDWNDVADEMDTDGWTFVHRCGETFGFGPH